MTGVLYLADFLFLGRVIVSKPDPPRLLKKGLGMRLRLGMRLISDMHQYRS